MVEELVAKLFLVVIVSKAIWLNVQSILKMKTKPSTLIIRYLLQSLSWLRNLGTEDHAHVFLWRAFNELGSCRGKLFCQNSVYFLIFFKKIFNLSISNTYIKNIILIYFQVKNTLHYKINKLSREIKLLIVI
jgi:hypothetical protein